MKKILNQYFFWIGPFLLTLISMIPLKAQWQQVSSGMYGGSVKSFSVCNGNIFAGVEEGGIYRFDTLTMSWTAVNNGFTNLTVNAIVSLGDDLIASLGNGIFYSNDLGNSWTLINPGLPATCMAVSGSVIFAGTPQGLFRSTDNGNTWTEVTSGLENTDIRSLTAQDGYVYAGTNGGGLFRSEDSGLSWTAVNVGLNNLFVYALFADAATIYAGTNGGGVFISYNNGTNWSVNNQGLSNLAIRCFTKFGYSMYTGTNSGGLFMSTFPSGPWVPLSNGLPDLSIRALASAGSRIYTGTNGGIYTSTDSGNSWTENNTGIICVRIKSLGKIISSNSLPLNFVFAATQSNGIYRSTDEGDSWTPVNNGLSDLSTNILAIDGNQLFLGTKNGGVYRSSDTGASWNPINTGITTLQITDFVRCSNHLFASTWNGGVFHSMDNGDHWSAVNIGLPDLIVKSLAVKGDTAFAGVGSDGVYMSTDYGVSWTSVNNNITNTWSVNSIVEYNNKLFASGPGYGMNRSDNAISFWTPVNDGLPTELINDCVHTDENFFIGTTDGVFKSDLDSIYWTSVNEGLDLLNVISLGFNINYIYAGISSASVWRRPFSDIITTAPFIGKNELKAFPNPVSDFLWIEIPDDLNGNLSFELYNACGKIITSGFVPSTAESYRIDISDEPDGLYFFKISDPSGRSKSIKIIHN